MMRFPRWGVLAVVVLASLSAPPAFGQYGGGFVGGGGGPFAGLGLYGGQGGYYQPGVDGSSLFNFGGGGIGPYGFGYDIGPSNRNLFGGSNYGRDGGMGFDFGRRGVPRYAPAPVPTSLTHEPGDGYRYPLYYDPASRSYLYYPVGR